MDSEARSNKPSGSGQVRSTRVLIVDDDPINVEIFRRELLRNGFSDIEEVTDPRMAVETFLRFGPHIVLLDLRMPFLDGFEVLAQLRALEESGAETAIIMVSVDAREETKARALMSGVIAYMSDPHQIISNVIELAGVDAKCA